MHSHTPHDPSEITPPTGPRRADAWASIALAIISAAWIATVFVIAMQVLLTIATAAPALPVPS